MDKGYIHVEITSNQTSKRPGSPCGDVLAYERGAVATTLVVSDGIGSGVKANIAAEMCVSRLTGLFQQGYSIRHAFESVVKTMEQVRGSELPYAVFTIVRILNDGVTTVLSYEMPPPIFVTPRYAQVLPQRSITMAGTVVGESNCHIAPNEGIIVVSDGITQAGLGVGLANGWTIDGAGQYINDCLSGGAKIKDIPKCLVSQARVVWKTTQGDDCTAVLASCRRGKTVNILTGPPSNRLKDGATVKKFLTSEGTKVVCGGTTSRLVADYLGTEVSVEIDAHSLLCPARYEIAGIDLVTEGAVTLNQVYNIYDEDPEVFDEISGVTELQELLRSADRVNMFVGQAVNPASRDISFRQKGILTRQAIIPLIATKLRESGKLVVTEYI